MDDINCLQGSNRPHKNPCMSLWSRCILYR